MRLNLLPYDSKHVMMVGVTCTRGCAIPYSGTGSALALAEVWVRLGSGVRQHGRRGIVGVGSDQHGDGAGGADGRGRRCQRRRAAACCSARDGLPLRSGGSAPPSGSPTRKCCGDTASTLSPSTSSFKCVRPLRAGSSPDMLLGQRREVLTAA